jgi:hypothetical protein
MADDTFVTPYHRWVVTRLHRVGILDAYEEATGGNNYHVALSDQQGRFILADCNDGEWRAGRWSSKDAYQDLEEGEMLDAPEGYDDFTDPADVAVWLIELWGQG